MARAKAGVGDLVPKTAPAMELTYPISPDYIRSWTAERAIAEVIANAIDADPDGFSVSNADGVLDITDGAALGSGAEGMVLGFSDKRGQDDKIGQFGEGLKIASLVLARDSAVGGMLIETVGYSVVPVVVDQEAMSGLSIPSKSGSPTKVLRWRLWSCDRPAGTRVRIAVSERIAKAAQARFLHLTETGYTPPSGAGRVIASGKTGRVYIGGVLVSERPGFAFSYDLSLQNSREMQNRDRVVIDGGHLNSAVRAAFKCCEDRGILTSLVQKAVFDKVAEAEGDFFAANDISSAQKRMLREIGQDIFGGESVFHAGNSSAEAEAALDLVDRGYKCLTAPSLTYWRAERMFGLLGVPSAAALAKGLAPRKREVAEWVADEDLTSAERSVLSRAVNLMRSLWGPQAVGRARVYGEVKMPGSECLDWSGFYEPGSGDTCIKRSQLARNAMAAQ